MGVFSHREKIGKKIVVTLEIRSDVMEGGSAKCKRTPLRLKKMSKK